jgi:hypothetical protein
VSVNCDNQDGDNADNDSYLLTYGYTTAGTPAGASSISFTTISNQYAEEVTVVTDSFDGATNHTSSVTAICCPK